MRRGTQLMSVALLALAVVTASCRKVSPLPASALADVATLEQFREIFNADVHRPRLLVLLSPT